MYHLPNFSRGNLYSRDLQDVLTNKVVSDSDFINTAHIGTLVGVVPQAVVPDFLNNYESISENVILGSAKQFNVVDKDGLTLWRIAVFKQNIDEMLAPKRRALPEEDEIPANKESEEEAE